MLPTVSPIVDHRCRGVAVPGPMVGGTNRESVRRDPGETNVLPLFPNVGPQQPQMQQVIAAAATTTTASAPCSSNNNHASSGFDSGMDVVGDGITFEVGDGNEEEDDGTNGIIGEAAAGAGVRSGSTDVSNREVRYAPSPTHSNPTTTCPQNPLQRAHSRFFPLIRLCLSV